MSPLLGSCSALGAITLTDMLIPPPLPPCAEASAVAQAQGTGFALASALAQASAGAAACGIQAQFPTMGGFPTMNLPGRRLRM